MRSGLRNADVELAPGGEVSRGAASWPESVGRKNAAALCGAGLSAARLTTPVVAAASANSASQSYTGTADMTDPVPASVSESTLLW